ncbi:MAG: hypothetical protein NUK63_01775 [Candidatus Bathyarchaeum tardum]|nr:MAG: hypothetical protein NUK63_01775 [Candidatus Bathyarchaeum tardum]
MAKHKQAFFSLTICCLLFLILPFNFEVKGSECIFFEDDFEGYYVNAFPSQNWNLRFNGACFDMQVIQNDTDVSSSKYLQLVSQVTWAARAMIPIPSEARFVGFEVRALLAEANGQYVHGARAGFSEYGSSLAANWHAHVCLYNNGEIGAANGSPLGIYDVGNWTKIRLLLDRDLNIYSVWIDDELKIENKVFPADPYLYNYFSLESTYHLNNKAYFDDVKLFTLYDANPRLDLQPTEGVSQTTIHGSGFAPNSEITVTWNETRMYTIPNLVQTDGYGNFSAMISVLNQTQTGSYPITAIDEMENQATSTFNVIPEFPSYFVLPLVVAVLLGARVYRKRLTK